MKKQLRMYKNLYMSYRLGNGAHEVVGGIRVLVQEIVHNDLCDIKNNLTKDAGPNDNIKTNISRNNNKITKFVNIKELWQQSYLLVLRKRFFAHQLHNFHEAVLLGQHIFGPVNKTD